jgi:hypothetical protein
MWRVRAEKGKNDMIFVLFVILIIIGLPLWLWLASRISQVSNSGALLGLFLVVPAFYWTYKLWHNPRANLRVPAIANLAINLIALPLLILYSTHYATSQARAAAAVPKDNPRMVRWCKEQNDAIYDPVLELCVEPTKAEVLAQEQRDNAMGQLEQYLNQHSLNGALDRNATTETDAFKARPDIADAATYQFSPVAPSRQPALMLLCLSESACAKLATKEKKESAEIAIAKGRLLLLMAPDTLDDAQLKKLKAAMVRFNPT